MLFQLYPNNQIGINRFSVNLLSGKFILMKETNFSIQLKNDIIRLRPIQAEDAAAFAPLTTDSSTWIYFTSDLSVKHELHAWVNQALLDLQNKVRLPFTLLINATNEIAGSSSLGNISYRDKRIEIGWTWIAKQFQEKGINKEMKLLMMQYCFEELGMERVEFKTDVLNMPARKALLKLGAVEEGILRSHTLMTHERRRDTIYYSVLRSEWETIKLINSWR